MTGESLITDVASNERFESFMGDRFIGVMDRPQSCPIERRSHGADGRIHGGPASGDRRGGSNASIGQTIEEINAASVTMSDRALTPPPAPSMTARVSEGEHGLQPK